MSQTVVNFLTQSGSSLVIDPRVFDFAISTNSQDTYTSLMNQLATALTNGDAFGIQSALQQLDGWSKMDYVSNGVQVTRAGYNLATNTYYNTAADLPSPLPSTVVTTTMNNYMASYVDQIVRTFRSAGWDPVADPISQAPAAIVAVQTNPSIYQVNTYITKALSAATQAHITGEAGITQSQSIQQLLMVDYISTGNDLLYSQMNGLQSAINLNQNALSYLNSLQGLMNQKSPQQFLMQLQLLSTTGTNALSDATYTAFENQTFNQQLGTVAKFTDGQLASYVNTVQTLGLTPVQLNSPTPIVLTADQYQAMQQTAAGTLLDLSTVQNMTATFDATNNGVNTIIGNIQFLINQISANAGTSAKALTQSLQTVLSDFQTLKTQGTAGAIVSWVQDSGVNQQGTYQQHLNDAVVASQSLNDTERENLRQVMFVFEEFYKSSTTMLDNINQLIQKMASAMSR